MSARPGSLGEGEPWPRRRMIFGRLVLALVALVIGGAVVVGALSTWGHLTRAAAALSEAAVALEAAQTDPVGAVGTVRERIAAVQTEVDALRPVAVPTAMVLGWLGDAPMVGAQARQLSATWTFGEAAIGAASELSGNGSVVEPDAGGEPITIRLADAAPDLTGRLQRATADVERAQLARQAIGVPDWPLQGLQPYLDRWDAVAFHGTSALGAASDSAPALFQALGTEGPRTYLVLVQTSDELRATGGFITSVGTVRVEHGRVTAVAFEKVYAAEGVDVGGPPPDDAGPAVQPPAPIERYLDAHRWALRDANWWADFPASARQAAELWARLKGETVDGVVAFDESALEGVLAAVGPVEVDGVGAVTAENVKMLTLGEVYQGIGPASWYANQSAFSQELSGAVLAAARRLPPERLPGALGQVRAVVGRHDLQVALFDSEGAAALARLGVDGAVGGSGGDDYLYVVESNVSYNKLSPFIRQDLDYAVELGPDGWPRSAALTVRGANTYQPGRGLSGYPAGYYVGWYPDAGSGGLDSELGFYGGYTRALVPAGSAVVGVTGLDSPDDGPSVTAEGGRTAIGWYSGLPMGARRQAQLAWVPRGQPSRPGRYRLLVQRQPGAPAHALTVRVALPPGWRATDVSPQPAQVEGGTVTWSVSLEADARFELRMEPERPAGGTS